MRSLASMDVIVPRVGMIRAAGKRPSCCRRCTAKRGDKLPPPDSFPPPHGRSLGSGARTVTAKVGIREGPADVRFGSFTTDAVEATRA